MPIANSPLAPTPTYSTLQSAYSGYGWSPTGASGSFVTWGQAIYLSYAFPNSGADYGVNYGAELNGRVSALNTSQQQVALSALQSWANVATINLTPGTTTGASLRFMFTTGAFDAPNGGAYTVASAYLPSGDFNSGDIWINGYLYNTDFAAGPAAGSNGWQAIVHEIGHALGLKHPFEGTTQLPLAYDTMYYTVMSYSAYPGHYLPNNSGGGSFMGGTLSFLPTGPMLYDIAAIQAMYGTNYSYNSGNNTYVFDQSKSYFETLWDGGGVDTIEQGAGFKDAIIDLRQGAFSRLGAGTVTISGANAGFDTTRSVAIAFGAFIENATGAEGFDQLQGNYLANALTGNGGNDLIYGDGGNDNVLGGTGNDTLNGDDGYDFIDAGRDNDLAYGGNDGDNILGGQGNDTLYGDAGDDYIDGGLDNDVAYGGIGNDTLAGIGGSDHLLGGAGNDVIVGGLDNDWLEGEGGDDIIYGDEGDDLITTGLTGSATVYGGVGNDSVTTYGNAVVYLGVGNNSLSTSLGGAVFAVGDVGVDTFTVRGRDTITAGDGNDIINLYGGGALIYGGNGNDIYNVYAPGDIVFETSTQGIDTVYNYGAAANLGASIENYYAWSVNAVSAYGNELNNLMFGNAVTNALNGGAGNDQLMGGDGDDFLLETDGVDVLFGDAGNDWLDGAFLNDALIGGAGNDQLFGGFGNDVLFGDNATSVNTINGVVVFNPNTTISTGAEQTWQINGQIVSAWGNDTVTVNDGVDWLWGQYGDDLMIGGGGEDVLFGGDGNDLIYGDSRTPIDAGSTTLPAIGSDIYNKDILSGDNGNDTLIGGASTDFLYGGEGNDVMFGYRDKFQSAGSSNAYLNATLTRGDLFFGGNGNDVLIGSTDSMGGNYVTPDQFWGGLGADVFVLGEAIISASSGVGGSTYIGNWAGLGTLSYLDANSPPWLGGAHNYRGGPNTIADFENGIDKIFLGTNFSQLGLGSQAYAAVRQLNSSNGFNTAGYSYAFNGVGTNWTTDKSKVLAISDNSDGTLLCVYGSTAAGGGASNWFVLAQLVGVNPNLIDSSDFIF
jgi:serralysin